MASSVSLSAPFVISSLPIETSTKSTRTGTYCQSSIVLNPTSSNASKKRKRTEVVVAVNSQGVNIIDVHTTKVLSAYSLPPSTQFSCPPVSVRSKDGQRRTYASASHPKGRILCWEETTIKRPDSSKSTSIVSSPASSEYGALDKEIRTHTHDLSGGNRVVRLEIFPRMKRVNSTLPSTDGDVLAVYEDGSFVCYSSDLKSEKWSYGRSTSKKISSITIFSIIMSFALARKTILKNRTDILGYENAPGDLVLLTIQTTEEHNKIGTMRCYNISPSAVAAHTRSLLSVPLNLPADAKEGWTTSKFSCHTPSGILHVMSNIDLLSFDLTLTIPTLLSNIQLPSSSDISSHSMIKISSTNVLVSTSNSIDLFNTKYKSIHATLKRPDNTSEGTRPKCITLLTYLQDIDLVVGHDDESVVGIQITKIGSFTGTSLLDSLCKGIKSVDLVSDKNQTMSMPQLCLPYGSTTKKNKTMSLQIAAQAESKKIALDTIRALQNAAASKDSQTFEKTFATFVGLDLDASQTSKSLPDFLYPENIDDVPLRALSQPFVTSVLGSIFSAHLTEKTENISMQVNLQAPNVLKFLLTEGLFSCTNLPNQGLGLVDALVKSDPELGMLQLVLELSNDHALPIKELVHAVQLVLEQLEDSSETGINNILIDNTPHSANSQDLAITNSTDEERLHSAATEAEHAITEAQHMIDLNDVKEQVLRAALVKINRLPKSTVVQALREGLGGAEQAGLIRILRRELIRDGEERPFLSTVYINGNLQEDVEVDEAEEEWLSLICDVLSCVLDAAGITGLLLAKDSLLPPAQLKTNKTSAPSTAVVKSATIDEEIADEDLLLTSLCSEVQTACQALEEVSTMSILLSDLLNRSVAIQASSQKQKPKNKQDHHIANNKTTRMSELEERRQAILPLGYSRSSNMVVQGKKQNKLDAARKNRTEQLKSSMMMGPYTLEKWYV